LHGGMVAREGLGFAFVGDKMSGKTTSVLSLLQKGDFSYCSNDDVTIILDDVKVKALGSPRSLCIRREALLKTNLITHSSTHPGNKWIKDFSYLYYYPNEIADYFNVQIVPSVTIRKMFFLRFIDNNARDAKIFKLPQENARSYLQLYIESPIKYMSFLKPYFRVDITKKKNIYDTMLRDIEFYVVEHSFSNIDHMIEMISEACKSR